MIKILSASLFVILAHSSMACLNSYTENRNGDEFHDGFFEVPTFYRSFDTLLSRVLIEDYERDHSDFDFKQLSDIAIHLTHIERY